MWTNVLWALNVMSMLVVKTQMALIYAPAYLLTVEMEETVQVTQSPKLDIYSFHKLLMTVLTSHTVTCLLTEKNILFLFSLEPAKCKDPSVPEFGHREGNNFIMGSEVVFSCKEGYELIGSSHLSCTEEGIWKGDVPYCKGRPSFQICLLELLFACMHWSVQHLGLV